MVTAINKIKFHNNIRVTYMKKSLRITLLTGGGLVALCACSQQPASVVEKGEMYYGRNETYKGGVEVPRYSDSNRAIQDPKIATKYISPKHEYAVSAAVPEVEVADVSTPRAPKAAVGDGKADRLADNQSDKAIKSAPRKTYALGGIEKSDTLEAGPKGGLKDMDVGLNELAELPDHGSPAAKVTPARVAAPRLAPLNERASNFIWPVEGNVISRFGPKKNGLVNDGINIAAPEGEPIWAAAGGEVVYTGSEMKGYGNMVILKHNNGWMTAYGHASQILVSKGDNVKQGDLIAFVGKTGGVKQSQLHFGMREGNAPVDPERLLPNHIASNN